MKHTIYINYIRLYLLLLILVMIQVSADIVHYYIRYLHAEDPLAFQQL
jgi:hypothetical protein